MISFGVIWQDTVDFATEVNLPVGGRIVIPDVEVSATVTVYVYDDDRIELDFDDIQVASATYGHHGSSWEFASIDCTAPLGRELWAAAETALRRHADDIIEKANPAPSPAWDRQQARAERFDMQRSEW